MKITGVCPKCGSQEVCPVPSSLWSECDPRIRIGWTIPTSFAVTRYLCGQCGYIEEWVREQDNLRTLAAILAARQPVQEEFAAPVFEDVDPSRCPACGDEIRPTDRICPSCGINFEALREEREL